MLRLFIAHTHIHAHIHIHTLEIANMNNSAKRKLKVLKITSVSMWQNLAEGDKNPLRDCFNELIFTLVEEEKVGWWRHNFQICTQTLETIQP